MAGNKRYSTAYYQQEPVALSRALLGATLVTRIRGVRTAGVIVEVETYLGADDPACHAARGVTPRNQVMFQSAGYCYVYLIYGMYHCVNVVSDREGIGSAVLIRAVRPLEGLDAMRRRRGSHVRGERDLARGPGRLCEAFGITTSLSGEHLGSSERIWIEPYERFGDESIGVSGRIGLSQGSELPLRFFLKDNPWVSGPRVTR